MAVHVLPYDTAHPGDTSDFSRQLRLFESCRADFADCLIERTAMAAGCTAVMTFDKAAAGAGMKLLV